MSGMSFVGPASQMASQLQVAQAQEAKGDCILKYCDKVKVIGVRSDAVYSKNSDQLKEEISTRGYSVEIVPNDKYKWDEYYFTNKQTNERVVIFGAKPNGDIETENYQRYFFGGFLGYLKEEKTSLVGKRPERFNPQPDYNADKRTTEPKAAGTANPANPPTTTTDNSTPLPAIRKLSDADVELIQKQHAARSQILTDQRPYSELASLASKEFGRVISQQTPSLTTPPPYTNTFYKEFLNAVIQYSSDSKELITQGKSLPNDAKDTVKQIADNLGDLTKLSQNPDDTYTGRLIDSNSHIQKALEDLNKLKPQQISPIRN
jgi:hypothetical protein